MPVTVTLLRGFAEDRRMSMEVYANGLSEALRASSPEQCQVREYLPRLPAWLGDDKWSLRLARYGIYPWQAHRRQGQINHILDHGYGHLVHVLDRERTVVTVHDLIPMARWRGGVPDLARGRKPWLNLFSFDALRRARYLIAVSESTRYDLIRYCKCAPGRISVIYQGVDPIFRSYCPAEKSLARQALGLQGDGTRWVLVMGSQVYKNQSGALRAFARLRVIYPGLLELLKTGPPNPEWSSGVEQLGLGEHVRSLGVVPRAELPNLYNAVDCLLFPSLYEGFGWPPLEAMACGTPVVASNAASLPEVIGEAGLLCAPNDHDGLAQAMCSVLTDDQLRQTLIERGLARARQFTWERTALQTLEVYERIA